MQKGFVQGIINSTNGENGILNNIKRNSGEEASYQLLRIYKKEGITHALFRLTGEAGLNYHDLTLSKKGNKVVASSFYIYMSGEPFSSTLRRMALPIIKEQNKNWLQKLTTDESEFAKSFDKFQIMTEEIRSGNFAGALSIYYQLPTSVQNDKTILLCRYQAASNVSDEELLKAANSFRQAYPDDICLDFLMIDYHFLNKQFDKVIECIDRLDNAVGGDKYLNLLRSNSLFEQGKVAEAIDCMQQTIDACPTIIDGYWGMLGLALNTQDHELTLQTLNQVEERFGVEMQDLRDVPEYREFANSNQGKQWLAAHGYTTEE